MTEKTLEIHLAELREQIALKIEAQFCVEGKPASCYGVNDEHCEVLTQAASIARGLVG